MNRNVPDRFVPRCTFDGRYEKVQCEGATCYCVNEYGHEIHETRTTLPDKPDCSDIGTRFIMLFTTGSFFYYNVLL